MQTTVELAMSVTLSPLKITDIFVSCVQLLQVSQNSTYAYHFFEFMVYLDPLLDHI